MPVLEEFTSEEEISHTSGNLSNHTVGQSRADIIISTQLPLSVLVGFIGIQIYRPLNLNPTSRPEDGLQAQWKASFVPVQIVTTLN